MRREITDTWIRGLRPPAAGRLEVWDARVRGLVLRITPAASSPGLSDAPRREGRRPARPSGHGQRWVCRMRANERGSSWPTLPAALIRWPLRRPPGRLVLPALAYPALRLV